MYTLHSKHALNIEVPMVTKLLVTTTYTSVRAKFGLIYTKIGRELEVECPGYMITGSASR